MLGGVCRRTHGLGRGQSVNCWAAAFLAVVLSLAGCAGTARQDSVDLAKAGSSIATAAQSNLAEVRTSLDGYVEGQYLRAKLSQGGVEPTADEIDSIRRIQRAITLRERALADLTTVYLTFQKLGEFDAAGEVEGRMNELTESINELGTTVGSDSPLLSHVNAGFIGKAAGALASEAQAGLLRRASPEIRTRLERLRDHMKRQQKLYDAQREVIANGRVLTAKTLYGKGVGDPTLVFREILAGYGLDYNEQEAAAKLQSLGDPGRAAMGSIIAYRAETAAYFEASILDEAISGANALIEQHLRLEAGESLSMSGVRRELALIQGLVDDYAKWRQLDRDEAAARKKPAAPSPPAAPPPVPASANSASSSESTR
jgi:hypothetical protein